MDIIEALKSENIRVSNGRRWLVWDEDSNEWMVYGQEYARRRALVIIATEDEAEAVKHLLYQEEA